MAKRRSHASLVVEPGYKPMLPATTLPFSGELLQAPAKAPGRLLFEAEEDIRCTVTAHVREEGRRVHLGELQALSPGYWETNNS